MRGRSPVVAHRSGAVVGSVNRHSGRRRFSSMLMTKWTPPYPVRARLRPSDVTGSFFLFLLLQLSAA
jgi:hypothetical protein